MWEKSENKMPYQFYYGIKYIEHIRIIILLYFFSLNEITESHNPMNLSFIIIIVINIICNYTA